MPLKFHGYSFRRQKLNCHICISYTKEINRQINLLSYNKSNTMSLIPFMWEAPMASNGKLILSGCPNTFDPLLTAKNICL